MELTNSQSAIGVGGPAGSGFLKTANLLGFAATPLLAGSRVWLCLLALAIPAAAQWRTGYFIQGDAAGQTAATIPWSKYTHVIHYALRPAYSNGACSLDTNYGHISGSNIADFVAAAHASGVKAIVGMVGDESREAINACTTPWNIAQFTALLSDFVAGNQYDGIDIDWETGVVAPQYEDLIEHLRAAMPSASLSAAVRFDQRYIAAAVQDELDQINIVAYDLDARDLSGGTMTHAWYNSATVQGTNTQDKAMDVLAQYYLSAGNAANKIGIGVPFYGRAKQACTDTTGSTGLTGPNQPWVSEISNHAIRYRDLVDSTYWKAGAHVWDDLRQSQYVRYLGGSCSTDAFIPYTGPEQLQAVAALIKEGKLGGIMTFGLPYEYMPAQTGDARYPLSAAIFDALAVTASAPARRKTARETSSLSSGAPATSTSGWSTPSIVTASPLPAAQVGAAYALALQATGATPIAWILAGGALPTGLGLSSVTGAISGKPTKPGVFTFIVTASNAYGFNAKFLSLTVNAAATPPSIVTTSPLPAAQVGTVYAQALQATGTAPITWTLKSGAIASGLTLASSAGTISGTPTAAGVFTLTVAATNSAGSQSKQLTLTVNAVVPPTSGVFTYYVDSAGGSDSNPGTQTAPWKTIAKVNSTNLSPGQSVGFKSGGTWYERLVPGQSGTAGSPITFGSYGSGAKPVINGANIVTGWAALVLYPPLDPSLVGYWAMEEPSGIRYDATTSGNNLAAAGGVGQSTAHKQGNYSASFSRANGQYLHDDAPSAAMPGSAHTPFTAGAWIQVNPGNTANLLGVMSVAFNWNIRKAANTGKIEFNIASSDGTHGPVTSNAGITEGSWVHVVGRYDGTNMNLFINGVKQTSTTTAPNLNVTDDTFYIGAETSSSNLFDGLIDGAFVYNRSLSDAEVLNAYNNGVAASPTPTGLYITAVPAEVDFVFEDGSLLPEATSSACMDGNWYWDTGGRLYYKPTTGAASGHTVGYIQTYLYNVGAIDVSNRTNITIDGLSMTDFNTGVLGVDSSAANANIVIRNCTFTYGHNAIYFLAGAHGDSVNGTVSNNYFYRTKAAVQLFANANAKYRHVGWTIANNEMDSVGTYDGTNRWPNSGDFEAVGVQNFQNGTVSDNYIHGGAVRGVFLYSISGGTCSGNMITRNRFYSTGAPAFLVMGDGAWAANANTFSYNVLWQVGNRVNGTNDSFALHLSQGPAGSATSYIVNNTIYGSGSEDAIYIYQGTAMFLNIENNALGGFSRSMLLVDAGKTNLDVDNNLYDADSKLYYNGALHTLAYVRSNAGWETRGLVGNALYTNAGTGDFTLGPGSPALRAGTYISGVSAANPPDIGAK